MVSKCCLHYSSELLGTMKLGGGGGGGGGSGNFD